MSGFCSEGAEKNIIYKRSISEEKKLRVRKNLSSEIPPDNPPNSIRTESNHIRIFFEVTWIVPREFSDVPPTQIYANML